MESTVKLLHKSLQDGHETLNILATQKEKLQVAENSLNKIDFSIRKSQRILRGMSSFFGSIRNWFSSKESLKELQQEKKELHSSVKDPVEVYNENPLDEASDLLDKLEDVANILNSELDKQNEIVERVKERTYDSKHKMKSLILKEKSILNST